MSVKCYGSTAISKIASQSSTLCTLAILKHFNASVAQLVEHRFEEPSVGGSIPSGGTIIDSVVIRVTAGPVLPREGEQRET